MNDRIKTVRERLEAEPAIDNSAAFERLSKIMTDLFAKLAGRFELEPSAANGKYRDYGSPDGKLRGSLAAFRGPRIDWLAKTWLGNPSTGFTNLHLNVWLGPDSRVPHLAIVLGTIPDLFFYMDYAPRTDLSIDLAYLDKYYEPINAQYLGFAANPKMKRFESVSLYMRTAISPAGICYTSDRTDESFALVEWTAHAMLDRWLGWVDRGDPVPVAEREALRARDLHFRRACGERDPANEIAVKVFGAAESHAMLAQLWGFE